MSNLIIIGGGAAGMMSAISARRHHPDLDITILDKTFALGRKILVCGAGRCNITNINLDKSIEDHYYGSNSTFIKSIFSQFGFKDIVEFFNELGVELYVERKTDIGKMFPVTDQAKTITEMLMDEIDRNHIKVQYNTQVTEISKNNETFDIKVNILDESGRPIKGEEYKSDYIILCAGGKTYPSYGSDGSGYALAAKFGHKVIPPVPSALSIEGESPLSHFLQGTKMEIEATSIIDNKQIKTRIDDVMFKKYGLSGPAILNISREISIHFNRENKNNCFVRLNFFPGKSQVEVKNLLNDRWQKRPNQTVEKSLYGIFPNKIPAQLLKIIEIDPVKKVSLLSESEKEKLLEQLTNTKIKITGTRGWNEAEFTAGGINTDDIKPLTLESKLVPNLYFAGEIMDVDGDVGGFNLSWSWASGFIAGKLSAVSNYKP